MKSQSDLNRRLKALQESVIEDDLAAALVEVDSLLETYPGIAPLLVLRGRLIQLQDGDSGPDLKEAREAFKKATEADENSLEAWNELAHYQLAVEDNARAAEKTFARAASLGAKLLVESLLGRSAALAELGKTGAAFDCLSLARTIEQELHDDSNAADPALLERFESLLGNHT